MAHTEKMTLEISGFKRETLRRFSFLRRIALSALVHLHFYHLVLWIGSYLKFSLPFEFSRTSWGDEKLNCHGRIVCWSVFHAEWMWVIRKGTAANENLWDCSQSIIHECKWHEKCAPCVAWQQETVMWYNHHMHVYVYSVNRKPPISTYERIFIDVLCA